jgi:hypothetical protein
MLELVRADAEQLFNSVQSTAQHADRIGSRARRLDLQQGNVSETLDLINLILDRTHCVSGVQQAMAAGDYDTAADHIATFLRLEQRLSPAVQGVDAGQAEEQRQVRCERLLLVRHEASLVVGSWKVAGRRFVFQQALVEGLGELHAAVDGQCGYGSVVRSAAEVNGHCGQSSGCCRLCRVWMLDKQKSSGRYV